MIFGDTGVFVPRLGFKCQPLFPCITGVIDASFAFMSLVGNIARMIGTLVMEFFKGVVEFIRGTFDFVRRVFTGGAKKTKKKLDRKTEMEVSLSGRGPGMPPGKEEVEEFVVQNQMGIFSEYQDKITNCARCQGRLKGLFTVDILSIAS